MIDVEFFNHFSQVQGYPLSIAQLGKDLSDLGSIIRRNSTRQRSQRSVFVVRLNLVHDKTMCFQHLNPFARPILPHVRMVMEVI